MSEHATGYRTDADDWRREELETLMADPATVCLTDADLGYTGRVEPEDEDEDELRRARRALGRGE